MSTTARKVRLQSLDVLRGFDMFWIIGGHHLLIAALVWLELPENWTQTIAQQFKHTGWAGFTFFDLIFPLFVFMSGVTIPFSHYSALNKGVHLKSLQWKVLKRSLLLITIGMSFTFFKWDAQEFKPYTVLGLIGGSYFIGTSFCLYFRKTGEQLAIIVGLLLAYHICFYWEAIPGNHHGLITPGNTFASHIDRHFIPGTYKLHMGVFDPEGPTRYFTGACLCILGCLIGSFIKKQEQPNARCSSILFILGLACLGFGWGWHQFLPIIKPLWTSSYVVFAAGWSLLLLAIFYQVIDVMQFKVFNMIFLPIGMNSITIYVGVKVIDFQHSRDYFLKGLSASLTPASQDLILAIGLITVEWFFLYFLYRNKLFLKV